MLVQRRRRWANIEPTLYQCIVFDGWFNPVVSFIRNINHWLCVDDIPETRGGRGGGGRVEPSPARDAHVYHGAYFHLDIYQTGLFSFISLVYVSIVKFNVNITRNT